MRHTLKRLASPGGEPHRNSKGRILAAITSLACAALATPAAAQQCSQASSYPDVVAAMYAQVMELGGGSDGLQGWTGALITGHTVKHMVASNVKWTGYDERHMNGRTSEEKLTNLYRHLLAREPDDAAWGWIGVGEDPNQGWDDVVDGLMNGAEYMAKFGDHIVPGDPVVAWDCTRATALAVAHNQGVRDVGQGGASVSYTTPAYVSLDQPRSLTFTYHSGLVDPRSQVQLNVVHASADAPDRVMMEVRNMEGSRETLTDGRLDVAFRVGQGASRVSAEFREPRHANANVSYDAVVRRYWADGRSAEERVRFRVANLDGRWSDFGYGWVLEGLQRLYDQGDGVHITEGATGLWFAQKGTAARADGTRHYSAPSGDFSAVVKEASGIYNRQYPDGTRVSFRGDGRMQTVKNRFGDSTRYEYDTAGRLVKVIDPVGKETTLGYTGTGTLAWVQDPAGRRVNTDSDGNRLWRFREPDNSVALDLHFANTPDRGYVLDSYWTAVGDRNAGLHTGYTFAYDAHGRVASVTAPQVKVTEPGVGDSVQMRPVVRSRSLQMSILGTGWLGNEVARVRPETIRVEVTDARNNTTRMAVDPLGIPVRVEEPLGRLSRGTTDRHGRMMRSVSPSKNTTVVEYSGVEPRKVINEGTGAVVQMTYEPTFHQLTRVWGTGTTEVVNTYDLTPQRKLQTSRTGPTGTETLYTFDARGRIKTVTDPEGHGTTYTYGGQAGSTYDNLRTVTTGSTSPRTTTTVYDRFGRDSLNISPGKDTTRTEYDLLNRVTRAIDPVGGVTAYRYMNGQLYQVTDPKLQTYSFHHDMLGQLGSAVDPRGQWSYAYYDRAGNPTFTRNRRGQVVTALYNALNQRTARYAGTNGTTWSYDSTSLWVASSNAESTDTTFFDAAGRALRTVSLLGAHRYTRTYTMDAEGRRTGLAATGPWSGARTIRYTYDTRGQLDTLQDLSGGTTVLRYDRDGLGASRSFPTGMEAFMGHASTHAGISFGYSSNVVGTDYKLGQNGLIDARVQYRSNAQLARMYSYDKRGWLRGFSDRKFTPSQIPNGGETCTGGESEGCAPPDPSCSAGQQQDEDTGVCLPQGSFDDLGGQAYTYDQVGNRTDPARNVTLATGNRLTGMDGYTLDYDADGNLTRKVKSGVDDVRPGWNALGQMDTVWRYQRGTVRYGYDAQGRRVRRTAPDGSVTRYLYDGDDLLMELDGAGNPVREYTYYPGVDQPHSVRMAGQTYYYVTDQPGSVTGLFNAANGVVNDYRYTPWGETEAGSVATVEQPLGYMAREWDDVAGMYQVRARWYDPQSGRFVSEDPIGLNGGLNPYVYANNSPTNLTDPYGLCPEQPRTTGESAHKENEKTLECIYALEGITAYGRRGANWLFGIARGDGASGRFGLRGSGVRFGGSSGGEASGSGGASAARSVSVTARLTRVAKEIAWGECTLDAASLALAFVGAGAAVKIAERAADKLMNEGRELYKAGRVYSALSKVDAAHATRGAIPWRMTGLFSLQVASTLPVISSAIDAYQLTQCVVRNY